MAIFNLNQFSNRLRISSYRLRLNEATISTRSAGGLLYRASYGPRLWEGDIQLTPYYSDDYRELDSLIAQIQSPFNYFVFSPPQRSIPKNFNGETFNGAAVRTNAVVGNSLNIKNAPADFVFVPGDLLSFSLAGCHRLYEVATQATVAENGNVTLTFTTPLTAGGLPTTDTLVNFVNPRLTAALVPGTLSGGEELLDRHSGYSFSFVQAIRGS